MATILTIDDEQNIRYSLRCYLEDYGYDILEAENGRIGLDLFDRSHPDLVLVDLRMPEIDGLDVLKRITATSPDTPIIVVSGTGVIADAVEALRLGAWDYLLKPIEDMNILLHAVERNLERAHLLSEKKAYHKRLEQEVKARTAELVETNRALEQEIEIRERAESAVRESEEKLRHIIESSPLGMHFYQSDDDGHLVFIGANPAADWTLRMDHSPYAGKTIQEVYPKFFNMAVPVEYSRISTMGETYRTEHRLTHKDNSLGVYEIHAFKASDSIVVTYFIDISNRVKTAAERDALITTLENKNAELERYAYTVSHDLKAPLITIKGFLGILKESLKSGSREQVDKCFDRIACATDKMKALLDDLLTYSRLGYVESEKTDIDINELLIDVLKLFERQIEDKNITVEIIPSFPKVRADKKRIFEVYQNLIDNAIRYCGGQGSPHIQIGCRYEDEIPVFYVKDNGVGIKPQYHDRVFGLFNQLDAESGGTGIGLTLIKRIIENNGGRIWIESQGGGSGTEFCFTLHPCEEKECLIAQ